MAGERLYQDEEGIFHKQFAIRHAPAGSSKGGQFVKSDSGGGSRASGTDRRAGAPSGGDRPRASGTDYRSLGPATPGGHAVGSKPTGKIGQDTTYNPTAGAHDQTLRTPGIGAAKGGKDGIGEAATEARLASGEHGGGFNSMSMMHKVGGINLAPLLKTSKDPKGNVVASLGGVQIGKVETVYGMPNVAHHTYTGDAMGGNKNQKAALEALAALHIKSGYKGVGGKAANPSVSNMTAPSLDAGKRTAGLSSGKK